MRQFGSPASEVPTGLAVGDVPVGRETAGRVACRAGGAPVQAATATTVSTQAATTMILDHHLAPERAGIVKRSRFG